MLPINALLLSKGGASTEAAIRYGTMDSFLEAITYAYGRTPPRRREGARRPARASARVEAPVRASDSTKAADAISPSGSGRAAAPAEQPPSRYSRSLVDTVSSSAAAAGMPQRTSVSIIAVTLDARCAASDPLT
jgi:hypothetical protein